MLNLTEKQKSIFNVLAEGILIIDREARVVFANDAYRRFLNMEESQIEGRVLTDFRPHAQLPSVVASGKAVLHAQRLEGLEEAYFVNMYPLKEDGVTVGGISVITFMSEAEKARKELEKYESRVRSQLLHQANKTATAYNFDDIVAVEEASIKAKRLAMKIAESDLSVLLQAESGSGKEMYAQSIHNYSRRGKNTFLAVNCANFQPNMLESELFGYVEGAFTGAKKGGKIGLMEAARGGTLFLDEISEMELGLQAKLLRALQERKIRPVGGLKEIDIDVRIICACNADLEKCIAEGRFRKDLYYRLNTSLIKIPSLRERPGDIPVIIDSILEQIRARERRRLFISDEALQYLMRYSWPGNVRELRNVLEFSAYMCEDDTIVLSSLPSNLLRESDEKQAVKLSERVKSFEKREIESTLKKHGNSLEGKKNAAKELGISLATLYNKLNQ